MGKMPAECLWCGPARVAYVAMCAASGYTALRHNGAAEMVRRLRADVVLALGAGPDPATELGILGALPFTPALTTAHDITLEAAVSTATRLRAAGYCSAAYPGNLPTALAYPKADLITLVGYTIGNFDDDEATAILSLARRAGKCLLIDAPVASAGDPRRGGGTYADTAGAEALWLHAAYTNWRDDELLETRPTVINSVVEDRPDGYVVRLVVGDDEIVRFHRRTVEGWLGLYRRAGWRRSAVRVLPGVVPRLVALVA